jgi:hypothetical protein
MPGDDTPARPRPRPRLGTPCVVTAPVPGFAPLRLARAGRRRGPRGTAPAAPHFTARGRRGAGRSARAPAHQPSPIAKSVSEPTGSAARQNSPQSGACRIICSAPRPPQGPSPGGATRAAPPSLFSDNLSSHRISWDPTLERPAPSFTPTPRPPHPPRLERSAPPRRAPRRLPRRARAGRPAQRRGPVGSPTLAFTPPFPPSHKHTVIQCQAPVGDACEASQALMLLCEPRPAACMPARRIRGANRRPPTNRRAGPPLGPRPRSPNPALRSTPERASKPQRARSLALATCGPRRTAAGPL